MTQMDAAIESTNAIVSAITDFYETALKEISDEHGFNLAQL